MSITLLQLKTQARNRADMNNSQFVSDAELVNYINNSIAELHDLLVASYGDDYNITTYSFTTAGDNNTYALPADAYKIRGVDCNISGNEYISLRPFNFNERNAKDDATWSFLTAPTLRYRLLGDNIVFSPKPSGVYSIRLWYTPVATKLSADTDVLKDLNQFSEYVIVDAAIKMMQKEESDVSVLMAQKMDLRKRIENMAQNRDSGQPESISDIYAENTDWWFFRG
jgi:hypothetical protein